MLAGNRRRLTTDTMKVFTATIDGNEARRPWRAAGADARPTSSCHSWSFSAPLTFLSGLRWPRVLSCFLRRLMVRSSTFRILMDSQSVSQSNDHCASNLLGHSELLLLLLRCMLKAEKRNPCFLPPLGPRSRP